MRGRFVVFLMIVGVALACEDANRLSVSRVFSGNNLQTIYSDTFSVFTSTVQLDSFLTNNSGTAMVGRYKDDSLGYVSASSYFQLCYTGSFIQYYTSFFDSAAMIFPYTRARTFTGDTTKLMTINGYEITQQMQLRMQPVGSEKLSYFNLSNGLFSNSTFTHAPDPIFSGTVKILPNTDSISIRVSDSFARNWFQMARKDSAHIFSNPNVFINFFRGMYVEADPSSEACVVGFNASKIKLRFYYKTFANGTLNQTHQDFTLYNPPFQFNAFKYDRSGTELSSLQPNEQISSRVTGDVSYVQSGSGLVTRLDFPSIKSFFANNPGITLNAAYLAVFPEAGTYPKNLLPPRQLQLFTTDNSNFPLGAVPNGVASIAYDFQYGLNTQYTFDVFPYLFSQIKSGTNYIIPLILAPGGGSLSTTVQRLYLGDRVHANTKIQLKIFYSYVQK